jgi:pimeloyl-[acyl-carrier protein] methyl ester esterase
LVLLHGWGMNARVWDAVLPGLSSFADVSAPDLPGHGGNPVALKDLPGVLDYLRDEMDAGPAVWVGWSLGGLLAQAFAARYPGRVRHLVLVAAQPRFVQARDWPQAMDSQVLNAFAGDLAGDFRKTLKRFLALQFHGVEGAQTTVRSLTHQLFELPPQPEALSVGLTMLRDLDLRERLRSLACPVDLILGEYDRLVPVDCAGPVTALAPGRIRAHVVARAGHAPFLTHPDLFSAWLRCIVEASD